MLPLVLAVLLASCGQPAAQSGLRPAVSPQAPLPSREVSAGGDIVVGMSAAFTGSSRGLGIELYRGSLAYLEHVNRAGGVNGRKILLKAYDDGYEPTPAIENTIRLVEQDNVFLLLDYVGTPTVTRVLPLLKKYAGRDIYLFFPFTGAQPHREAPYDGLVFNLRASYREETEGLVDHFMAIGRERIAVFYQADSYGRSGWDGVRRALAKRGLKIVGEATYQRGTPFTQSLDRQVEILRAARPDAVISIGAYAAVAAFVRDARDAGWDVPLANVSFVGSQSLLSLLTEAGRTKGRSYTSNLINSEVVPSYEDVSLPVVREYRELMDRYNPSPPKELTGDGYVPERYSQVSLEGFLNAKILVEALRKMGDTPDRTKIKETVEALQNLNVGVGAAVSFGPGNHQGLHAVYYTSVVDGRFVPLADWRQWAR